MSMSLNAVTGGGRRGGNMFGGSPPRRPKKGRGNKQYVVINGVAYPKASGRSNRRRDYDDYEDSYDRVFMNEPNINYNLSRQPSYARLPPTRSQRPRQRANTGDYLQRHPIDVTPLIEKGINKGGAYAAKKANQGIRMGIGGLKRRINERRGVVMKREDQKRAMDRARARAEFVKKYSKSNDAPQIDESRVV